MTAARSFSIIVDCLLLLKKKTVITDFRNKFISSCEVSKTEYSCGRFLMSSNLVFASTLCASLAKQRREGQSLGLDSNNKCALRFLETFQRTMLNVVYTKSSKIHKPITESAPRLIQSISRDVCSLFVNPLLEDPLPSGLETSSHRVQLLYWLTRRCFFLLLQKVSKTNCVLNYFGFES